MKSRDFISYDLCNLIIIFEPHIFFLVVLYDFLIFLSLSHNPKPFGVGLITSGIIYARCY